MSSAVQPNYSSRRLLVSLVVGLFVVFGTLGLPPIAEPASANAAAKGSYVKNCLNKSPVTKKCVIWGAPYWVASGKKLSNGESNKFLNACGGGMTVAAVIGLITTAVSGPVGGGAFAYAVFIGCAGSMAEAAAFK